MWRGPPAPPPAPAGPRRRWPGLLLAPAAAGLGVIVTALLGEAQLPIFVYVAVMAMFSLPGRWGPIAVITLIVTTALAQRLIPTWTTDFSVQFQIFIGG